MRNVTRTLSKYVWELNYDDVPTDVIELLKLYIADYFAASFAGYKINSVFNEAILDIIADRGGRGKSTVLVQGMKLPAEDTAYLNAAFAQGADMDDGNKKAMGHIATHTMSSVFAVAEGMEVTWDKVMIAILCGYEVFNRLAGAVQPGIVARGFHSTGITGPIASAAACAKLMDLSEEQIYNAISLAALQSSGLLTITESGQACKPINAANAARNGVISAKLASRGIEAPRNPLEGRKGWIHAVSDNYHESVIYDNLGKTFTICESYLKPYASCRHTHYGIECALEIRKQIIACYGAVVSDQIKDIIMEIYPTATAVSGEVVVPQSTDDAKFSLHYTLATGLLKGEFGFADLSAEAINNKVCEVINKIKVVADPNLENTQIGLRQCIVTIQMYDGKIFRQMVEVPKGDANNPFTWEDIQTKMLDCTEDVIESQQAEALLKTIKEIDPKAAFVYPGR